MADNIEIMVAEVLKKLNGEVIPGISELRKEVAVIQEGNRSRALETIRIAAHVDELEDIIKGDGNRKGLSTRIELMETWIGNQVWIQRIIVGAVVAEIVGLFILLFSG